MNKDKIEAIIFDLGGVILDIDYNRTVNAFKELGFRDFATQYSKMKQSGLFDQLERGEISKSAFVKALQSEIPSRSEEEIIAAWNAIILEYPAGRLNYIQQLRAQLPCYLLSNTNEIHLAYFDELLNRTSEFQGIHACFDQAYLSHEIGARKPEPRAWQLIIEKHNLSTSNTLFIDDSPQHINAAHNLGLQTLHLMEINDLEKKLGSLLA